MKKIERLEREKQLLQEIYDLKKKIKEVEKDYVVTPYYPDPNGWPNYPRPFEWPTYPFICQDYPGTTSGYQTDDVTTSRAV